MTKQLALLFVLSCLLSAGQSVLTTPNDAARSSQTAAEDGDSDRSPTLPVPPTSPPADKQKHFVVADRPTGESGAATPAVPIRVIHPITRSDFELFAEDAAGHPLPVYGRQLFEQAPSTFAPMDLIPVPADYVLGPGDELLIRVWGKVDLDARATVDRNGQISLPKIGTLTVAGLRYEQLDGYLRTAVGTLYKDFELNVTLGQLRSMQIFVLGNARQPGAYTVGSLSTLVDALFASGGPSAHGTMRDIQLRRGNRLLSDFDLYDLLQRGDKSHDVQLLPGDVIYIPPIGPQVAIIEDVKEPGIYELKGTTTIASVLESAGGLTSQSAVDRVLLERIEDHRGRLVEEFPLDKAGLQRTLQDGDLLRMFPLSPKFANAVTLRGNVLQPGRYVWHQGMRISDLIPSRSFILTREYWNRQNHLVPGNARSGADNPSGGESSATSDLQSEESEKGYWNRQAGLVPDSRDHPIEQARRNAAPNIGENNAEVNWEYAVIERLDDHDLSTRLIAFNLGRALDDPGSHENQRLMAGDVVTILSRADAPLPVEQRATFVRVNGEVRAPGVYRVDPGETLRGVVARAGGLMPHAYLYASLLFRASTRQAEELELKVARDRLQRELLSAFANGPATNGANADQQSHLALQQEMMARIPTIQPTGRVVLEMKPDAVAISDIPDFPLEDGDSFYIPSLLSTVQVSGSVYNQNAFRHEPGKSLNSYLNDAGGGTRSADKHRIFVIRADGRVVSRQSYSNAFHDSFGNLRLLPGDSIVVPEKIKVSSRMDTFLLSTQLASQAAVTAAALSLIK